MYLLLKIITTLTVYVKLLQRVVGFYIDLIIQVLELRVWNQAIKAFGRIKS